MTPKESLENAIKFRDSLITEYEISAKLVNEVDHSSSALVPAMELQRHLIRAIGAIDVIIMMLISSVNHDGEAASSEKK